MIQTALAPLVQNYFASRLVQQRQVSPNTIDSYRDTFRLLFEFASKKLKKLPNEFYLHELDASLIGEFLNELELKRKNSVRTRNARLAAIRSFYRYLSLLKPEHAGLIKCVLAIPQKRFQKNIVSFLEQKEVDAILASPNTKSWIGRRDHAILVVLVQTGLRVSELIGLKREDVELGPSPHLRCLGKGRKERCTPLTRQTVAVLKAWLRETDDASSVPLFPNIKGGFLNRDTVAWMTRKYRLLAAKQVSTLNKKSASPHTFRHTSAVRLLQSGVDRSVIALWLGHEQVETTQIYLHADLSIKELALQRTAPLQSQTPTRYRPTDKILAFLQSL